jgi:anti-anti-sigma regulatory factor
MKHEIIEKPDACVVVFTGEIDLESSPVAREILIKCFKNTRTSRRRSQAEMT